MAVAPSRHTDVGVHVGPRTPPTWSPDDGARVGQKVRAAERPLVEVDVARQLAPVGTAERVQVEVEERTGDGHVRGSVRAVPGHPSRQEEDPPPRSVRRLERDGGHVAARARRLRVHEHRPRQVRQVLVDPLDHEVAVERRLLAERTLQIGGVAGDLEQHPSWPEPPPVVARPAPHGR
jgi:hypothetical protein